MKSKHLIRIAALAAACIGTTAFAGLPWADASSHARTAKARHASGMCVRSDADDTPGCLGLAPRGKRGPRGRQGHIGAVGPVGVVGPVGPVGAQGPQGPRGIQGIQGIKGPPGAFYQDPANPTNDGSDPGGSTQTYYGTPLPPVTFNSIGNKGRELPPAVASCPISGPDQEAYDGGAIITTSNPNISGATGDVVELESSFPGTYVAQTEVDPVPTGVSEAANAYEAQAVVGNIANVGDQVTVQAYVVCGP